MIKTPTKFIALLYGAALLTSSAFAQGVATDPVGYVTYDVAANSDVKFGSPLERSALLLDAAEAVISGTITTSVDASAATDGHYVQFTSGGLAGSWYQVSTADTSSITVAEDLTALGAVGGDSFKVVPFWTLGTLMSGFPGSTNPSAPEALVLVNDVTSEGLNPSSSASYWYYSGETGPPQGFYDSDNPSAGVQDSITIPAGAAFVVRRGASSDAVVDWTAPLPYSL